MGTNLRLKSLVLEMKGKSMSLREVIGAELPFLRRYARALTGSQSLGDAAVRETIEALIEAPDAFDSTKPPREELFRLFQHVWPASSIGTVEVTSRDGSVASLPISARQTLLLTAVEGFSEIEAANILSMDIAKVRDHLAESRIAMINALGGTVMIIEDESIIALHLKSIVRGLGHEVTGIVRTHREAVKLASDVPPDLILADISLADGSSGMDAVQEILKEQFVPVIFITAFPERLLTGNRLEPAYLITKPFEPETVAATIWQAMIAHREHERIAA
jgi:DNA-directed RNA polymerase specialized sigma24 family protein/CheY-like chemotaxis protein